MHYSALSEYLFDSWNGPLPATTLERSTESRLFAYVLLRRLDDKLMVTLLDIDAIELDATELHINPPQLPIELLQLILSNVGRHDDLLALCHTSRLLRVLALPLFFRVVDMSHRGVRVYSRQQTFKVLKLLKIAETAVHVTDFRVSTMAWNLCPKRTSLLGLPSQCACDTLDQHMGDSLKAMINLESLSWECGLCYHENKSRRHHYITEVKTRSLRYFALRCYCEPNSKGRFERILTAPMLSTVTTLKWTQFLQPLAGQYMNEILERKETLPRLDTLYHFGNQSQNVMLATRPIRRIFISSVPVGDKNFLRALEKSPGELTHISVNRFYQLTKLLTLAPSQFVNLQHIGTVPGTGGYADVERVLSPYRPLQHLASIDTCAVFGNAWNTALLDRLKGWHPKLITVIFHGQSDYVCEFKGGTWEGRHLRAISPWDIIRGTWDSDSRIRY